MKAPSLTTASGNAPFAPLADQAARELSISEELDPGRRRRLECTGSLAKLMLQATIVKTYERDS